jgi:predicted DsbA family dithiol-disulfide isomerase
MNHHQLTIDVYSDIVCPWCYVGKRRLERALASSGGGARVAWRPFQLNPTMPRDGMDRKTYLEIKFGSLDAFERLEGEVLAVGAAEGISFAFGKIERTPNTFAAHRLVRHAQRHNRQNEMVDRLFHGYFEEGCDIGNLDTLVCLAAEAGLEGEQVRTLLASDEEAVEVRAEEAAGHRLGIRGVPYFVINGAYAISGAHPSETFVSAFRRLEADRAEAATGR